MLLFLDHVTSDSEIASENLKIWPKIDDRAVLLKNPKAKDADVKKCLKRYEIRSCQQCVELQVNCQNAKPKSFSQIRPKQTYKTTKTAVRSYKFSFTLGRPQKPLIFHELIFYKYF